MLTLMEERRHPSRIAIGICLHQEYACHTQTARTLYIHLLVFFNSYLQVDVGVRLQKSFYRAVQFYWNFNDDPLFRGVSCTPRMVSRVKPLALWNFAQGSFRVSQPVAVESFYITLKIIIGNERLSEKYALLRERIFIVYTVDLKLLKKKIPSHLFRKSIFREFSHSRLIVAKKKKLSQAFVFIDKLNSVRTSRFILAIVDDSTTI